jgi:oligopeptide/dipeptide ABC transporter ATP-binding protein
VDAGSPTRTCANEIGAPDAIIDVRGLKTSFATPLGTLQAVDGVSFRVGASEMLAIVGESGSGKSVTGLSIMRLFGRTGAHIDAGELWFKSSGGAVDLARIDEDAMARIRGQEIAIIFQDPMSSLNPVLTIGDQIGEGLRVHKGLSRAQARAAAIALLTRVGIPDAVERARAYPHQFSGGMRQRVMIAIALAAGPRLLIADEPTTALDVTIQAQIVALLKGLQRDARMAMIFITHDLALVGDIADRVAVMYAGEIVETGPAQQVVAAPRHPYTRALVACMARHAPTEGGRRRPRPSPGTLPDPYLRSVGCRFAPRCPLADAACRTRVVSLDEISPERAVRCLKWREVAA